MSKQWASDRVMRLPIVLWVESHIDLPPAFVSGLRQHRIRAAIDDRALRGQRGRLMQLGLYLRSQLRRTRYAAIGIEADDEPRLQTGLVDGSDGNVPAAPHGRDQRVH